jgi:hypothetical protein
VTDATSAEEPSRRPASGSENWNRWGKEDVFGTLNFIDGAKRRAASEVVRSGETISLSIEYGLQGPQSGNIGRFNPVHTMTLTEETTRSLPHGIGAADDVIMMPMQCATHWDGLGHIYDHGTAWNGRKASDVVNSSGDTVTGIERVTHAFTSRGILLRTGHLSRCRREGWGQFAGGPAPGVSFGTIDWILDTLAEKCAADGIYDCLIVAAPLAVKGGVGAPVNPVAVR